VAGAQNLVVFGLVFLGQAGWVNIGIGFADNIN